MKTKAVRIHGKNDLRLDEMGFIFQQMYMLKNLTVLDNIILGDEDTKAGYVLKIVIE